MTASTEPQPAADNPILASIRRLLQQIEDSKPNLICAPDDKERIAQALEDKQMTHMVNLYPSPLCKPGEAYVAKSTWRGSL